MSWVSSASRRAEAALACQLCLVRFAPRFINTNATMSPTAIKARITMIKPQGVELSSLDAGTGATVVLVVVLDDTLVVVAGATVVVAGGSVVVVGTTVLVVVSAATVVV